MEQLDQQHVIITTDAYGYESVMLVSSGDVKMSGLSAGEGVHWASINGYSVG